MYKTTNTQFKYINTYTIYINMLFFNNSPFFLIMCYDELNLNTKKKNREIKYNIL